MISVIMPLVQRQQPPLFWWTRGLLYLGASVIGGALVGALLGIAGGLLRAVLPAGVLAALVALLALAYGLHEAGIIRLPHPERAWQVPASWIRKRPLLGAAAFGLILGTGLLTFIPFTAFYLLLAWELLLANPWVGLLLGATYGLVRAVPALAGGALTARQDVLGHTHTDLLAAQPLIHRVGSAVLLLVGVLTLPLFFILH